MCNVIWQEEKIMCHDVIPFYFLLHTKINFRFKLFEFLVNRQYIKERWMINIKSKNYIYSHHKYKKHMNLASKLKFNKSNSCTEMKSLRLTYHWEARVRNTICHITQHQFEPFRFKGTFSGHQACHCWSFTTTSLIHSYRWGWGQRGHISRDFTLTGL